MVTKGSKREAEQRRQKGAGRQQTQQRKRCQRQSLVRAQLACQATAKRTSAASPLPCPTVDLGTSLQGSPELCRCPQSTPRWPAPASTEWQRGGAVERVRPTTASIHTTWQLCTAHLHDGHAAGRVDIQQPLRLVGKVNEGLGVRYVFLFERQQRAVAERACRRWTHGSAGVRGVPEGSRPGSALIAA